MIQLLSLLLLIGIIIFIFWGYKNMHVNSVVADVTAKEVSRREKLSSSDFKKNHEYYRYIIKNYSPVLLSYIDNFKLDLPRDIIGTIMILENKDYLKVEEGIFVNTNMEIYKLSKMEKYILKNISSGNLTINPGEIIKITQEEGLEKGVITLNNKYKESKIGIIMKRLTFIIFVIILFLGEFEKILSKNEFYYYIKSFFGIGIIICIFILLTYFLYEQKLNENRKKDPYFRTKEGNELNEKLEGLKEYLKDYGDMKGKNAEMISLWEDYLIYAIIFKQNNIAQTKYLKYIKIL